MTGQSHFVRTLDAVCSPDCTLPPEARHLAMVMALGADSTTGVGFKGQKTLAEMLGKSVRQVRRLIDVVNSTPGSPVRIDQTPRFRSEGRGRTSNSYQLVLTNRTPTSPKSGEQPDMDVLLNESTNRTPETRLTGHQSTTNRTPTSGDLSAKLSARRSAMSLGAPKRTKAKRRWTRVPKGWQPSEKHRALAAELGVDFNHELAQFRDNDFKSPKKDADACFRTWLRNAKKFQERQAPGKQLQQQPQRGMADHVEAGGVDGL